MQNASGPSTIRVVHGRGEGNISNDNYVTWVVRSTELMRTNEIRLVFCILDERRRVKRNEPGNNYFATFHTCYILRDSIILFLFKIFEYIKE